jgi:hypothetical protein
MTVENVSGFTPARPADIVTLVCPRCLRRKHVARDAADPAATVTVRIICQTCDDGDFHEPQHFDADGKWIGGEA